MQPMQNENGVQKGLKTILSERGLWRDGMRKQEALSVLLEEEDFNPQNILSLLDETAMEFGV